MRNLFYFLLLSFTSLYAKELFTQKHILLYLNDENPYYYSAIAKEQVSRSKELSFRAAFDLVVDAQYDDKNYEISSGTFQNVALKQSIGNGMEFSVAYRNAQGTQEYNNIKTSEQGEALAHIKLPIASILNNTSKNRVNYENSVLTTQMLHQKSRKNLLLLYFEVSKSYYKVLLQKEILATEKELLQKAKNNFSYISKEINLGSLPQVALIEVKGEIINRKQRFIQAQNRFFIEKNLFLQYINLTTETFDEHYDLDDLENADIIKMNFEKTYSGAITNNPQLRDIDVSLEKSKLNKDYNEMKKYPRLDVNLFANYDFEYEEGYKIALDFNFPIQRSKYKGENEAIQKEILLLQNEKEKIKQKIAVDIKNSLQKLQMQERIIELSKEELSLSKQLEKIEYKKFQKGVSSVLFINQREINTLLVKQKLLKYYYLIELIRIKLEYKLGKEF